MVTAAEYVKRKLNIAPDVGVVLGSGLSSFADRLEGRTVIPYRELPDFPQSTAVGHQGELVAGNLGGKRIVILSGRFHLYEGYSAQQVVEGIQLLRALGIRTVVLTNAAGGINMALHQGALVLISDHINLQGTNPLVGPNDEMSGPRFPDMTEAYSIRLRRIAMEAAHELGITLFEGVYAAVIGPSYETPAEIRYLRIIGADLVGMSTVSEAIAANYMGMEVLGISCVTNLAAGLGGSKLEHKEVLETGNRVAADFGQLLATIIVKF